MSYAEKTLSSGEEIVYTEKLHWIIYIPAAILFMIFFSGGVSVLFSGSGSGLLIILVGFAFPLHAYLTRMSSEFTITTKRVVMKTGLIRNRAVDILLSKIEGVMVNQGIFGRIFDYGTVIPGGSGGTKDGFNKVASPLEFRKKVQDQIDALSKPQ